jgi:ribA/ribD-fused uncharacterized protein
MDNCSYFIKDKAIFGSFPTQKIIHELENLGVRYFIDLTTEEEKKRKIIPYTTKYTYINFPIVDRHIPIDLHAYAKFILRICNIIETTNDLIYLSCRGGHGRSGVVVATILCHKFGLSPEEALQQTTIYHSNRRILKDKWRKIGSPQTYTQKKFIFKFCIPLRFYRTYKHTNTYGFSIYSNHTVYIEGIGTFPTAESAFQAHKDLNNIAHINSQLKVKTVLMAKHLGNKIIPREDWEEVKIGIMERILQLKFDQHDDIRENLLNTGLRPLVEHTKDDSFWGDGGDGSGQNNLGKILTKIRNRYYENME